MSASHLDHDAKVHEIVHSCRSAITLHPAVSELWQSRESKRIFWDSLNQDLHVICQRSHILAYGEITIFQKAFAVLMEKEEDVIPAVEVYVDEILGLKFVSEMDRATTLNAMIQTRRSILGQAYDSKPNQSSGAAHHALPSSSQSALSDHRPVNDALFVSDGSEPHVTSDQDEKGFGVHTSGGLASSSNDDDEKLKRLFIVYHKARKDFDATLAKTLERTKSAKFLRDTVENCLAYIAAKQTRHGGSKAEVTCGERMLVDLKTTLEETIAIVEQGSGGKKRRFDENWENVPQAPARMRGPSVAQPLGNSDPVPRGGTSEKRRRLIASRIQEHQETPKPEYRQQRMRLAEPRGLHLPRQLYPAPTGQPGRRILGDRQKPRAERYPFNGRAFGDCYRPTYS